MYVCGVFFISRCGEMKVKDATCNTVIVAEALFVKLH